MYLRKIYENSATILCSFSNIQSELNKTINLRSKQLRISNQSFQEKSIPMNQNCLCLLFFPLAPKIIFFPVIALIRVLPLKNKQIINYFRNFKNTSPALPFFFYFLFFYLLLLFRVFFLPVTLDFLDCCSVHPNGKRRNVFERLRRVQVFKSSFISNLWDASPTEQLDWNWAGEYNFRNRWRSKLQRILFAISRYGKC